MVRIFHLRTTTTTLLKFYVLLNHHHQTNKQNLTNGIIMLLLYLYIYSKDIAPLYLWYTIYENEKKNVIKICCFYHQRTLKYLGIYTVYTTTFNLRYPKPIYVHKSRSTNTRKIKKRLKKIAENYFLLHIFMIHS